MKKLLLATIFVALLALTAIGASALTVSVGNLGGTSQKRDINATSTITVTNDGANTVTINNIATKAGFDQTRYQAAISGATFPLTLNAGDSQSFTLTAFVPTDFDAVDDSLEETAFKIGDLVVTGDDSGTAITAETAINMQAINELEIRKVRVKISGSVNKDRSVGDGSKVDDIKPGDSISVEVEVENTFSSSSSSKSKLNTDIDFSDVRVFMEVTGDSDFDIDDDEDSLSVDAGDDDQVTFRMDAEDDADDRNHIVEIMADGVDDNGARHGAKRRFNLDVQREAHDIIFRNAEILPSTISCNARTVRFSSTIRNQGRLDEDDVVVELQIPDLSIVEKSSPIELDEDDSTSVEILATLPENVKPGVYSVNLFSMYDLSVKNNFYGLTFTMPDCSEPEPTPTVDETPAAPQQPVVIQPPVVSQPVTATIDQNNDNSKENLYLYGLIAAVLVVVVLIGLLLAMAFKKR